MSEQLDDDYDDLDETVCICSGTTKRKIVQLIKDGCNLDTVSRKTRNNFSQIMIKYPKH